MLKKSVLYFLLFLVAFSFFLLAKAPASVIWEKALQDNAAVKSALRSNGVSIKDVDGTIWDGRALIQYKGISSIVDWDVKLSEIFTLALPIEVNVESHAGELEIFAVAGLSQAELLVSRGEIDLPVLNSVLRAQRVTLDGSLLIKDLKFVFEGKQLRYANGLVSWSGGDIAYPAQRKIHQRTLPPFKVTVETKDDGVIRAGVRDSGGRFDVVEADVSSEGEAMLRVKRRLLDLADEHWPQNSDEQDIVFKVKKKIY